MERYARILSTKHAPIMVSSKRNNWRKSHDICTTSISQQSSAKLKFLAVIEYNKGKCDIDYLNQMVCYASTIRKGIKWYRKLGIQLLLGISVVNVLIV